MSSESAGQRCGNCRWWKLNNKHPVDDYSTGDCTYPLPICLVERITPYAKAGKDCPTWQAKHQSMIADDWEPVEP